MDKNRHAHQDACESGQPWCTRFENNQRHKPDHSGGDEPGETRHTHGPDAALLRVLATLLRTQRIFLAGGLGRPSGGSPRAVNLCWIQ
jgi:hypothetical protein